MIERLPRCEIHGIERFGCPDDCPDNGNGFTMTPIEKELVMGVLHINDVEHTIGRRAVEWRFTPRPKVQWQAPDPQPESCDQTHTRAPGQPLCPACTTYLDQLQTDAPHMLEALHQASIGDTRFVPHAITRDPDESPVPWHEAAQQRHRNITRILNTTTHKPDLLRALSWEMAAAHRIIDRPADRVYVGVCEQCGNDLDAQRGHNVTCRSGCYTTTWADHLEQVLNQSHDRLLTESELVAALGVERRIVRNLTRRMEGHQLTRPHLTGHSITTSEVTVYRLGDVLDAKARHDERHAKLTNAERATLVPRGLR